MTKIGSFFHFSKFRPEISANHPKPAPEKAKSFQEKPFRCKINEYMKNRLFYDFFWILFGEYREMGYFCKEIELKLTVHLLPWDLKTTHNQPSVGMFQF